MASVAYKVKIPTFMDPFIVEVNGQQYKYPAGTEQNVPEEVAAVIQNINDMTPKPTGGSGGGGAGTMVVNITPVSAAEQAAEPQFIADKTYEEVLDAVLSGKIVVANFNSIDGIVVSQLSGVNPDFAVFCGLTGPYLSVLYLYQDNHIEIESFELAVS